MKHFALIAMTLALGLTACGPDRPPPPPPPPASPPSPPPPPPAPPPGGITITGTVTSVAGRCNRIAADGGQSYAVHRGVLRGIPRGARVQVVGVVSATQDCPGATVLRATGGVRRLGPGRG